MTEAQVDKDGRKLVSVSIEDARITSGLEGDRYIVRIDYTLVSRWEKPLAEHDRALQAQNKTEG